MTDGATTEGARNGAGSQASKRAHWQQQLREWRGSGQTQPAFCAQRRLSRHSFGYWKGVLEDTPTSTPATLVEVPSASRLLGNQDEALLAVGVAGQYRVEIWEGFDAVTLRRLIQVLQAR